MSEEVLTIDDRELKILMNRLSRRMRDMSPVMSELGEIALSSIEKNFEVGGRYSSPDSWRGGSKKWKPLASATIKQREKEGKWPGQILVKSAGGLAPSISTYVTKDSVSVGTNKVYAAIHQFGGRAGRGHKVTIPARPYIVIQDEDITEMKAAVTDYLTGGIR
jgi:phage virion morphogenesis protein